MERLFAPWRIKYIKSGALDGEGCFLCDKFSDEGNDRENLLLYRGEHCFVIQNLYPYTNGHIMIVPIRHISDFTKLTKDELLEINLLTQVIIKVMEDTMEAQGFNVGFNLGRVAGAGCDTHLHLHIVPRWSGDTNFMPVLSDTKVISEALLETYDNLKPEIEKYAREVL